MRVAREPGAKLTGMTNHAHPNAPRNRRFLVSIWQRNGRPDESADYAENDSRLHGLVWEADPRDPGRITTPEAFTVLSALPRIFGDFLCSGTKARESAASESEGDS